MQLPSKDQTFRSHHTFSRLSQPDLAAAAPYYKTTGTRNKLDQRFNKALRELNKVDGEKFQVYILLHGAQAQGVVLQVSSCRAPPSRGPGEDDSDGGEGE